MNEAQRSSGVIPPETRSPSSRIPANGASAKADGSRVVEPERSNTPWSRPAPGTSAARPASPGKVSAPSTRAGQPQGPRPSSPSAPRTPGKTAPGKSVSAPPGGRSRREEKRDDIRLATRDEARELAEALTARHGLRVLGFETPGIGLDTLREIAAALDDVLSAHPYIALPEFAIAECGDGIARLGHVRNEGSAPVITGLTMNIEFAKNAAALAAKVAVESGSGKLARGSETRPVYSAIVRELGHALDVMGGFAARPISQRTLIAEYLDECGDSRFDTSLAGIVRGYLRWRGRLSRYGFPKGRFEPGMALADAFVEVQLNPADAGAPARALRRLLVETAERRSAKDSGFGQV
ncbi:hypothetical protein J2W56_002798 [Nocardia kruczakiae]|uniref:Uncharacterized protein n=1 Tax=Nocardia kruczakiae TaxID=261477 RepID=A0ABU1XEU0_9NOCA|nr:hypothetical protein [Nocardia kruczakiae]MDR7169057.1 hypothetical protein [Nocardia kruczakiae]